MVEGKFFFAHRLHLPTPATPFDKIFIQGDQDPLSEDSVAETDLSGTAGICGQILWSLEEPPPHLPNF